MKSKAFFKGYWLGIAIGERKHRVALFVGKWWGRITWWADVIRVREFFSGLKRGLKEGWEERPEYVFLPLEEELMEQKK